MPQGYKKDGTKLIPPSPKGTVWTEERKDKLRQQRIGIPRPLSVMETMKKTWFQKGIIPHNKGKEHLREENNPGWKGDGVGYIALHSWVRRYKGKPIKCENEDCIYPRADKNGRVLVAPKRYDWANISHEYKRDLNDWKQLCVSCHKRYDIEYRLIK